jgi:branched-chain amino acid transport system substrate-binding protein
MSVPVPDQGNVMKKGRMMLGIRLALATLVVGITLSSGTTALKADPIKVGVMGPYTGPSALVGQEIRNGTQLAVEDARAAGELPV